MGSIVLDSSCQASLGGFSLPRFRAPPRGLRLMCMFVFAIFKSGGGRTPSDQLALCEIMCNCIVCIHLFTKLA